MNTWIHQVLSSEHATITVLIAAFFMGMITVVSCGCNFAILGAVAGYTSASSTADKTKTVWMRGFAFLIGGIISMATIGALFGYAGSIISHSFGNYWKIAGGLVMIFFGLYSLNLLPFNLPELKIKRKQTNQGVLAAIVFGLTIGGLSAALNTCCNPMFPVILAASFVKGSVLWGLMMLTTYACGYGLPMAATIVGFGLGLGKISKTAAMVNKVVAYIGGTTLVVLGFYLLITI